jgi:hypothetical protein
LADEKDCPHLISEGGKCIDCGADAPAARWTMEEIDEGINEIEDPVIETSTSENFKEGDKVLSDGPAAEYFREQYATSGIPQIIKLAEETWSEYERRATENEEPGRPTTPRMRMIGGRFMRIPFHQIFKEIATGSYDKARGFGYLGSYDAWCRCIQEAQPRPRPN